MTKSCEQVEKPKGDTVPDKAKSKLKGNIQPLIKSNGQCSRCLYQNLTDESVCCRLCSQLFHTLCKEKRGTPAKEAACPVSFLNKFKPLSAKYNLNGVRYGNFVFICEDCDKTIQQKSNESNSNVVNSADAEVQTIPKDMVDESSADKSSVTIEQMKDLFVEMKKDILDNVNKVIDCKLDTSSQSPDVQTSVVQQLYSKVLNKQHTNIVSPQSISLGPMKSIEPSDQEETENLILSSDNQSIDYKLIHDTITEVLYNVPVSFV